jgi:DNA-binding LytR/AlgR family response regulator
MKRDYSCQNEKKIILRENKKTLQVDIKIISYIECDSYISTIHFVNEEKPVITGKLLKLFEIELSELGFVRANRNTLVNVKHIESIENCNNRILTLVTKEQIPISCRQLSKIKMIMNN